MEALRSQLKQAESKVEELAERLKNTTASMEQYKAMSLRLEESLDKEKQVCGMIKITIICFTLTPFTFHKNKDNMNNGCFKEVNRVHFDICIYLVKKFLCLSTFR